LASTRFSRRDSKGSDREDWPDYIADREYGRLSHVLP
jgi:hypothetical protein